MKIIGVKLPGTRYNYIINQQKVDNQIYSPAKLYGSNKIERDVFIKSNNISFQGAERAVNQVFKHRFTPKFFNKLLKEGLPCAYTGIQLIPLKEINELQKAKIFKMQSSIAIKHLRKYKDSLFGLEKSIYDLLEKESKKHPTLKLQELLQLKYRVAEKNLIKTQGSILNQIGILAKELPQDETATIQQIIHNAFEQILKNEPKPEERFKRMTIIRQLFESNISNKKIKQKILNKANQLPQSSNSINAFIVKYSQPYKIRKGKNGELIRLHRDSEELAFRILKPSIATDEHIYPHALYRQDAIVNPNEKQMEVTILTSSKINGIKSDTLMDEFIMNSEYDIPTNIQKHINRLIEIYKKWASKGSNYKENTERLEEYIRILQKEFIKRSSLVNVDIKELDKLTKNGSESIKVNSVKKAKRKKVKLPKEKKKRAKKTGRAANSHSEEYIGPNGKVMKNRKVQTHSARFSH